MHSTSMHNDSNESDNQVPKNIDVDDDSDAGDNVLHESRMQIAAKYVC